MLIFAALSMLFTLPGAAQYGDGGGGGGGGGGGQPEDTTGSIYADLTLILRAENGTPILKKYVVPPSDEDPDGSTEYCVQPLSYEPVSGITPTTNPVDDRQVWVLPLQGEWLTDPPDPLPVAEIEACDPFPQYAMFVSEVELERLNLARTDESVLDQKLADIETKLFLGSTVTLEATGRIRIDDKTIDASPENQAIYASLMSTGTIPGLRVGDFMVPGPPAAIGPVGPGNSQFDAWELAAMTIGAAASKGTPLTIDAVEYYNRIIGFPPPADPTATPPVPDYTSPWGVTFVRSEDPTNAGTELAGSERFVDYSGFTYNRSQTFMGSVTWLDVAALQWKVSKITDVVPFTNLSGLPEIGNNTLTGITAFAQLADDVRAMSNFVPDNTFIPGFYMDVPGVDTTLDQLAAITDPAVDLGTLPLDVFKTFPFQVTMSLLNPWGGWTLDQPPVWWGGTLIPDARLRVTIDAADAFAEGDLSAIAADSQAVPFSVDGDGDLVGWWGPESGFPVPPGYNVSTTFDVTIADTAPIGDYGITLDLVTAALPDTVLASESGSIAVNENVATVLWGDPLPKLATQGGPFTLPVVVYAPEAGTAELTLTITGPGDDPTSTEVVEAMAAGDVKVYGDTGTDMVAMTLALDGTGNLVGTWEASVLAGFNPVTWYVTVQDGALVGNYAFGVALTGGNTLDTHTVAVAPPAVHGEQPGDFTIAVTPVFTPGSNAEFTFEVVEGDAAGVIFQCKLEKDGVLYLEQGDTVEEEWKTCTSPKEYTGLPAGHYEFFVRGKRGEVLSPVVSQTWVVTDGGGGGGGGGGTSTTTTTTPGGGGGDPVSAAMVDLAGDDRIATAIEVSREQFPETASAAVLANAGVFADALAGTPLAEAKGAPMLLTYTGGLDSRVAAELDRVLEPGATVYLLGGTAALSESVEAALSQMGYQPVRFAGADRYETSVKIAEGLGNPTTVFLTTGHDFADGLTAGTAAAMVDGAVLLTDGAAMAAPVVAHLAAHPVQTRYAVGGPAMRADSGAEPIAGADRFATAAMVASRFFEVPVFVGMASGETFPDALSGGVAAAMHGGPLMLSASDALSTATSQYLTAHADSIEEVHFYGGMAAMSQAVRDGVASSLG